MVELVEANAIEAVKSRITNKILVTGLHIEAIKFGKIVTIRQAKRKPRIVGERVLVTVDGLDFEVSAKRYILNGEPTNTFAYIGTLVD